MPPRAWIDTNGALKSGYPAEADYRNKVEYQPYCIGDWAARGEVHLGYGDNLRAYQAWFATKDCPACNGYGVVRTIYSNTANEPNLTMVAKGQPPRYMPEVTNHLMKPCYFGMVPTLPYTILATPYVAATQSSPEIPAVAAVEVTDPPFGLQPFYNTDGDRKSTRELQSRQYLVCRLLL